MLNDLEGRVCIGLLQLFLKSIPYEWRRDCQDVKRPPRLARKVGVVMKRLSVIAFFLFFATTAALAERNPDADTMERVQELRGLIKDTRGFNYLPHEVTFDSAYGRAWLYILQTSADKKTQVISLRAVYTLHSPNPSAGSTINGKPYQRLMTTKEVKAAVRKHLSSSDRQVLLAAIHASRDSVWGSDPDIATARLLLKLQRTSEDPQTRRDALGACGSYMRADPLVAEAQLRALKDSYPANRDSALKSIAAKHRKGIRYSDQLERRLYAGTTALLKDSSPAVRGQAAIVCARVVPKEERMTLADRLFRLLADPHPLVRSRAAAGLARMKHLPAVHRLMRLVDDGANSKFDLDVGDRTTVHEYGSDLQTVDDAVLRALHDLTGELGPTRFEYALYKESRPSADLQPKIKSEARRARTWYNLHRSMFPQR
jgi:hypothetical protein